MWNRRLRSRHGVLDEADGPTKRCRHQRSIRVSLHRAQADKTRIGDGLAKIGEKMENTLLGAE